MSYSKSFQPSAEGFALAANNAQIAPEETTNHEVGAKFDFFDGMASATASLFRLERTNIKTTNPATNTLVAVGVQRTDGAELSFSGDLSHGWQIWSGYAWLDAEMVSSVAVDAGRPVQGKRSTLTPKQSANLWLTKALGNGFGTGAGLNYVGECFANPGNTVTEVRRGHAALLSTMRLAPAAERATEMLHAQEALGDFFDSEIVPALREPLRSGDVVPDSPVPVRDVDAPLDTQRHLFPGWAALGEADREDWRAIDHESPGGTTALDVAWYQADGQQSVHAIAETLRLEGHPVPPEVVQRFFDAAVRMGLAHWRPPHM